MLCKDYHNGKMNMNETRNWSYILSGSLSVLVLLLGDLIVTMFSLLETLCPTEEKFEDQESDADDEKPAYVKYSVFCDAGFISSLCEALGELLKYPDEDFGMKELIDDVQVPPGHIQTAIRYGLGCLCYLMKVPNGRCALGKPGLGLLNLNHDFFLHFCAFISRISLPCRYICNLCIIPVINFLLQQESG
jgi:hypothetical protein